VDTVTVECDRCHRPGWWLEVSEATGDVFVDGARIGGADGSRYWAAVLGGPRAHRYQLDEHGARPGAFVLTADPAGGYGDRHKLICIGRRHPRYERVITSESAARAYHAAVAAGRDRIGLREIA
jgi:hypothetical protein